MKKTLFGFALSILLFLPIISASANANVVYNFQFFYKGPNTTINKLTLRNNAINNKQIWVYAQKSGQSPDINENEIEINQLSQMTDGSGKATYSCASNYMPVFASGLNVSPDIIKHYIWVDSHPQTAAATPRKAVKIFKLQADKLNQVYLPSTATPPSATPTNPNPNPKTKPIVPPKPY